MQLGRRTVGQTVVFPSGVLNHFISSWMGTARLYCSGRLEKRYRPASSSKRTCNIGGSTHSVQGWWRGQGPLLCCTVGCRCSSHARLQFPQREEHRTATPCSFAADLPIKGTDDALGGLPDVGPLASKLCPQECVSHLCTCTPTPTPAHLYVAHASLVCQVRTSKLLGVLGHAAGDVVVCPQPSH